jgi:hypothetical protein
LAEGARRFMARETGMDDMDALAAHMETVCQSANDAITRLVGDGDDKG